LAIELPDLHEVIQLLKQRSDLPKGRLLILGSADVHVSRKQYQSLLQGCQFDPFTIPDVLTPFSLGESLGFQTTETLDVNGEATITHNLMEDVPVNLHEKYDLIIDAGVLFWCFNPGLALENIFRMLKPNGDVLHITAVSGFYGRGYYNVHPKALDDFYKVNGCQFLFASYRSKQFRSTILHRALNRLSALLQFRPYPFYFSRSEGFGHIHFAEPKSRRYAFKRDAPESEPHFIPNDILGVFAFRKLMSGNSVNPLLFLKHGNLIATESEPSRY
jgi:SAM-dependent methyltransferase